MPRPQNPGRTRPNTPARPRTNTPGRERPDTPGRTRPNTPGPGRTRSNTPVLNQPLTLTPTRIDKRPNIDYQVLRAITAPGNFNAGLQLITFKFNGRKVYGVRKKFTVEDVHNGFAEREIRHIRFLQGCKNICGYWDYDYDLRNNRASLTTQWYRNESLWALLTRHITRSVRFSERFIWHVLVSLTNALLHMQRGTPPVTGSIHNHIWILHRDIWPSNIFLGLPDHPDDFARVVLGDLGSSISRDDWRAKRHVTLRQQPDFKAPESTLVDERSDVYQVGLNAVALCRLTKTPRDFRQSRFDTYPAGSGYSDRLNWVLRHCLKEQAEERCSVRQLKVALRGADCMARAGDHPLIRTQDP